MMKQIIDSINNFVDKYLNLAREYVAPGNDFNIMKYVLAGFLLIAAFCFFFYLRKYHIIGNKFSEAKEKIYLEKMGKKQKKTSKDKEIKKEVKKENGLLVSMRNKFVYSQLGKKITYLSFDVWIAFLFILFIICLFVFSVTTQDVVATILFSIFTVSVPLIIEAILAYKNFKATDDDLLEFLNLLGNFSTGNSEITDIFSKFYRKMNEPLRGALEECIYEAESVGIQEALTNLTNKIEHPRFKEIIQNLRIANKYSASYKTVADNNRQILTDYLKTKKSKDSLIAQNMISLVITLTISALVCFIIGNIVEVNVFDYLLMVRQGRIALSVIIASVVFFITQIYSIDK